MFLQIIDFLVVFPPQGQGLELVKSNDKSATDLFPLKTPFKALYSLNTLSMCLHEAALAVDVSQTTFPFDRYMLTNLADYCPTRLCLAQYSGASCVFDVG
jgi:hypothetical protein